MDLKKPIWHGRLEVSGTKPIDSTGSIIAMTTEFISHLRTLSPRESAKGKSVTLSFQTSPFDSLSPIDALASEVEIRLEAEGAMPTAEGGPQEGETYDSFLLRLMESGNTLATAQFIANDWFGIAQDSTLAKWLSDPKAIRFRELNFSNSSYEAALPTEYEELKSYVRTQYPEQCKELMFRTA